MVILLAGANQIGTTIVKSDGSWTTDVTLSGDGAHTLTATDVDAAGNVGTSNSIAFTLDTTGPAITIGQSLTHDTGILPTDWITSDGHLTLSGTVSDANGVSSVELFDGTTDLGAAIISSNGAWTFPTLLGEGSHALHAVATDVASNPTTTLTQTTITVDKTAPIPFMSDAILNTNNSLTTLSGMSEANSTVSVLDGTKLLGKATADSFGNWSLQANITGQVHQFTESATDLAGNTGSSSGVTVYAPSVNKTLAGGSGNDFLIAGPKDTLTGGAGNDTFVFNANFGKEVIKDFDVNHDALAFSHTLFVNDTPTQVLSQAHDSSAGAVIAVDINNTITLTGVHVSDLQTHASDFHFF